MSGATQKTAFVFAGGGSLGAVQVGMLRELMRHGLDADFVVGSSVGALNAAYFGAIARALHAITLLIANQIVRDLKELAGKVDISIVPSLCPLDVSPYDFSNAEQLIERAADITRKWVESGGLSRPDTPNSLLPHSH